MAGSTRFGRKVRVFASSLIVSLVLTPGLAATEAGKATTRPASGRPVPATTQTAPATQPASPGGGSVSGVTSPQAGRGESVVFTTEDNLVIAGSYWPARRSGDRAPMVILLHMYKGNRSEFDPLVGPLIRAGFSVLAIDLRGHGGSAGPAPMKLADRVDRRDEELFRDMHLDVTAACEWLRDQPGVDPARFALVGASVGGSVALDYAGRDKSVDAVVCLTPGTSYLGLDALGAVRKYGDRPLLLIASEAERDAADHLRRPAGQATARIVPGPSSGEDRMALHGTRMLDRGLGIETQIVEFLKKAVGPAAEEPVVASIKGKVYYEPGSSQARRLTRDNLRWFSSAAEAESRGLRAPASSNRSRSRRGDDGSSGRGSDESFPDGR
ncbi:MAG TPA: alpha/beta fold hydrolase [Phycisphaerae bacterium]|nr:alpha/beta fold hydrolase [Phycisphaerae bacterium]